MMDPNVESRITERLSALHAHLHGKGPSAARTYITGDDVVVVVLEETFTPAEQTLVDRGEAGAIQELRRRLRRVMADDFGAIVEQATGRRVRSYISDTDLAEQVSIDVFLLGASLEDMSGFEAAGDSDGSGGS
ncbi:MAG: Na-translocating system protein MpsC family protein [Solirubrobacteraceae bacterium]